MKTMKRIYFNEVATRDGFQIEPQFIPTEGKVALVDALSDCGYAKIEVLSLRQKPFRCCATLRR